MLIYVYMHMCMQMCVCAFIHGQTRIGDEPCMVEEVLDKVGYISIRSQSYHK